jgi:hypothetical protein
MGDREKRIKETDRERNKEKGQLYVHIVQCTHMVGMEGKYFLYIMYFGLQEAKPPPCLWRGNIVLQVHTVLHDVCTLCEQNDARVEKFISSTGAPTDLIQERESIVILLKNAFVLQNGKAKLFRENLKNNTSDSSILHSLPLVKCTGLILVFCFSSRPRHPVVNHQIHAT